MERCKWTQREENNTAANRSSPFAVRFAWPVRLRWRRRSRSRSGSRGEKGRSERTNDLRSGRPLSLRPLLLAFICCRMRVLARRILRDRWLVPQPPLIPFPHPNLLLEPLLIFSPLLVELVKAGCLDRLVGARSYTRSLP